MHGHMNVKKCIPFLFNGIQWQVIMIHFSVVCVILKE